VIATATNTVVGSPITVGLVPFGVAVTPDGSKVYVANQGSNNVSVIATATNTVVGSPITVGLVPFGVAVTPDGSKVYVANQFSNTVSVIATATNTVVGSPITVGKQPIAFGLFIQPVRVFSAFTAQLTVYPNQKEFSINSSFTLGPTSNAINPLTEPVTLKIGSFTITIPPGSFVNAGAPGYFTFVGVIDGVSLNVLIRQISGNNYIFGVIAKNVSLTINNPVTVTRPRVCSGSLLTPSRARNTRLLHEVAVCNHSHSINRPRKLRLLVRVTVKHGSKDNPLSQAQTVFPLILTVPGGSHTG
jgi:YVTN family beta-propeller protein